MLNKQTFVLGVGGEFTKEELKELADKLSKKQVDIQQYQVNSIEADEVIRLAFFNFDAYTFLRDGVLFEVLWWTLSKAGQWVLSKKPKAKIMQKIDLRFKTKAGEISVNMGLPLDSQLARGEIEKTLTVEFLEGFKEGDAVNVYWDTEKNTVSVTKL